MSDLTKNLASPTKKSGRYYTTDSIRSRTILPAIVEPPEITTEMERLWDIVAPFYTLSNGVLRKREKNYHPSKEVMAAIQTLIKVRGYKVSYYLKKVAEPMYVPSKSRTTEIAAAARSNRITEAQKRSQTVLEELNRVDPIIRKSPEPPDLALADAWIAPKKDSPFFP